MHGYLDYIIYFYHEAHSPKPKNFHLSLNFGFKIKYAKVSSKYDDLNYILHFVDEIDRHSSLHANSTCFNYLVDGNQQFHYFAY